MKKIIYLLALVFTSSSVFACDICGCGVGGSYIGILPEFHKHVFGLRYRYNSLQSHLGTGGSITYLTSAEYYHTVELWGGWNIGKKFRLMANIPYAFNERSNQGTRLSKNGPGDITVTGFYQLFNKGKTTGGGKMMMQTLWLGAGIKLPSGKYTAADKQSTSQQTNLFQLGTGSTDFILQGMYDLRLQDAGINISASYKMNTANRYDYNYGNKLSGSLQLYYKWRIGKTITLAPNAGLLYENAKKDIDEKIIADISGGSILLGMAGLEANANKIAIGAGWQSPLTQNLANGIVRSNNRLMVHMSVRL